MIELNEIPPFIAKHPGEYVKQELDKIGWQQQDLASVMDVSMKHVSEILNKKKGITFETASLLSQALGYTVEYWVQLDTIYRQYVKSQKEAKKRSVIEDRAYIYLRMPILEMQKRGWIKKGKTIEDLKKEVLRFWTISSMDLNFMESLPKPAYRTGVRPYNHYFASCWFHRAKSIAESKKAKPYKRDELVQLVDTIGQYLRGLDKISSFIQALENAGVVFFVLPHLKQTYNNGAAFMIGDNKPVIVLTMRFDRIDHFWFTILHELAHVLFHSEQLKVGLIDSENTDSNEIEKEADAKANEWLNGPKILSHFVEGSFVSDMEIRRIAKTLGMHPSIVRGILMWNGRIEPSRIHKDNASVFKSLDKWKED